MDFWELTPERKKGGGGGVTWPLLLWHKSFPLSHNSSNISLKQLLVRRSLIVCLHWRKSEDARRHLMWTPCFVALWECTCVFNPRQAQMHYLRCCCDTCACLKVSASFKHHATSVHLCPHLQRNQSATCWRWSTYQQRSKPRWGEREIDIHW